MAIDPTKIVVGAHSSLSIGAWVTAKGAGTLTEVGSTMKGVSIDPKTEFHDVVIDQRLGVISKIPIKRTLEIKTMIAESALENFRQACGQPAANLTGTPPNLTLLLDPSAAEQYFQIVIVGKGVGTTKVRTFSFWRCVFKDVGAILLKKDAEQAFDDSIEVCEETTGTGLDNWGKVVDA